MPERLRKTETAPSRGWSPRRWRHPAARPSMPWRQSTGAGAKKLRLCGGSWSIPLPPKRPAPPPPQARSTRGTAGGDAPQQGAPCRFPYLLWLAARRVRPGPRQRGGHGRSGRPRGGQRGHGLLQVTGGDPPVLRHPAVGQHLGEHSGWRPERVRKACARVRAGRALGFTLARQLVELMVGMQRGGGVHDRLPGGGA